MCLIRGNSDISGPGVRAALYAQNLLCFIPPIWAIWDGHVSDYELESMENHSTTNLIFAFAILISCFVQALTRDLTNFHGSIVLSMSWMNNTNAFVYFILYIRYKSQEGKGHVEPNWSAWRTHIINKLRSVLYFPAALILGGASSTPDAQDAKNAAPKLEAPEIAKKGGVKVIFKRFALVLGSLHLTVMAALGIWLWSNPRQFGTPDSSCAVDYARVAVLGARVPFGSNALRLFALAMYSLFLMPGLNLLLPMAAFLGLSFWHHLRRSKPPTGDATPGPAPDHTPPSSPYPQIFRTLRDGYTRSFRSPVFHVCAGLGLLLIINVIFITDIELTLAGNRNIQEVEETQWGFGQILAMLLVFIPLRDLVEMILARRLRRQEEQIQQQKLTADWKAAIVTQDVPVLLELVTKRGADPNVKNDDGFTALEVAILKKNWDAVAILTSATPSRADVSVPFHNGRTAVEVTALNHDWEPLKILLRENADIDARNSAGQTALELAARDKNWSTVEALVGLSVDVNTIFSDSRTVLELVTEGSEWELVRHLVGTGANPNVPSQGLYGSALQAACHMGSLDIANFLLENAADPNLQGGKYGSALQAACCRGSFKIASLLLEKGANPNLQGGEYGSALQAACFGGSLEIASLLLGNGANPNLHGGEYGLALQAACFKGSLEIASLLLEKGADPNLQGGEYGSALQAACYKGEHAIACLLLEKGADPKVLGGKYGSALQAASWRGSPPIVQLLLERGVDPNVQGGFYGTALHATCSEVEPDVVRILLDHHADPNMRDSNGHTPLQCMIGSQTRSWATEDRRKITELLRQHGAVDTDDSS